MQQIGVITSSGTMVKTMQADFKFYTCPVCKQAISRNPSSVTGHLAQHVRSGQVRRGAIFYIKDLLCNFRGCNARLAALDENLRLYVSEFVSELRSSSQGERGSDARHVRI